MAKSEGWKEWEERAANLLKAELKRHGINHYSELTEQLNKMGLAETLMSVSLKVNRGKYQHAFFLACMAAIEAIEEEKRN